MYSKNQSFEDSQEINRRMDQLKRSLGLPLNKSEALSMSEDTIFEKYINRKEPQSAVLQQSAKSVGKQKNTKDFSNYLDLEEDRFLI